jgi:Ca2+-binding EF-hand superfamily protein
LCRSGSLEYTEFLIASKGFEEMMTDENLRFVFDILDINNTGELSAKNINPSVNIDLATWEDLIAEVSDQL